MSAISFNIDQSKILWSGNGLTLSQTGPLFFRVFRTSLENSVSKREIACSEQFLLFTQCFQPFYRAFSSKLKICLQTLSVWKSLKFYCPLGKG